MQLRALLVPLTVLGLALAGCSQPGGDTSQTTEVPAPVVLPASPTDIALTGCTNFGGVFPVPMEAAQALLPEGFKPVPVPGDPQGGATLYVLVVVCDDGIINGTSNRVLNLLAYEELAVVPDAAHTVQGVSDYTVPIFMAAAPKSLAAAFKDMQLGQYGGVSFGPYVTGTIEALGSINGTGFKVTGQIVQGSPTALDSGDFVLFGVRDRQVVSTVNGTSAGGDALQAAVVLQALGDPPLVPQARPATRGFTVSGFSLHYASQ